MNETTVLTGAELNRAIAGYMGWRYELVREDREYEAGPVWIYFTSHGEKPRAVLMISSHSEPSSDYVWKRLIAENKLPDWANDLDAAMNLCMEIVTARDGDTETEDGHIVGGSMLSLTPHVAAFYYFGDREEWIPLDDQTPLATDLARLALRALSA